MAVDVDQKDTLFESDKERQDFYEILGELKATNAVSSGISGVYVIYDKHTDEPLYVGESSNVVQRLYNHFSGSQNAGLQQRVAESSTDYENLWDETAVKWVEINEDKSVRKRYESVLEIELEPKFSSR